jgi:hypothetical protein
MNNTVHALIVFDDGTGPALYAGGSFTTAGGVAVNRIARWNGQSWSALGTGMDEAVLALEVFDPGTGRALFAGGGFTTAGGVGARLIARWDGTSWSALGGGFTRYNVQSLRAFDDGTGEALYAGGMFVRAGGEAASHIARWNGTSWSAVRSGMNSSVRSMAVFDDGTGPALYATGYFTSAGGRASSYIAKLGVGRRHRDRGAN